MKFKLIIFFIVFGIALGTSVLFLFPYNPAYPPKANETGWTEEGVKRIVEANNKFALEFYQKINEKDKNIFFSPYSIFSVLAITYEGARGQTAEEMKNVFHFPDNMRNNFARIYNEINKGDKDYELRTGNALWIQKDYPVLDDYKIVTEKFYGAKASNLDFVNENEKSKETINNFIERQTNGKIKDLIKNLEPTTRLIITNAIYFKGDWLFEFDEKETRKQDFWVNEKEKVEVDMMFLNPKGLKEIPKFNYTDLGSIKILELPYKGEDISMIIILPDKLEDIEPITTEKLKEWKSNMKEEVLDGIYIPKFELTKRYELSKVLYDMGMKCAFSDCADFSGIDGTRNLFITSVIHQAYVKVDEKGTEAAAATAVILGESAMQKPKIFRADHPFVFIIQKRDTGQILFFGKIVNPNLKD
jgi:serpin B